MNEHPVMMVIMSVCALMGFGGVFVGQRWARDLLWILAVPPCSFALVSLAQGFLTKAPVQHDMLLLYCVGLFWPLVGCLIGEYATNLRMPVKMFSDLFISTDEEAVTYDSSPRLFAKRAEHQGIGTLELAKLRAILRQGRSNAAKASDFTCLLSRLGNTRLIHRLPDDMVDDLARLTPERMTVVTENWAAAGLWGWQEGHFRRVLDDLVQLSRVAVKSGRNIYLWNCENSGEVSRRHLFPEPYAG